MPAMTDWSRSTPLSCCAAVLGEDRGEHLEGERVVERVGAEPRDPGDLRRVADDVHRQLLAVPGLGEVEARRRRRGATRSASGPLPFGLGGAVGSVLRQLQPAGPGQVDHQVQAVDVQVEELPVPARRP